MAAQFDAGTAVIAGGARDDRKTASVAAANSRVRPGVTHVTGFAQFREIMRSPDMLQANVPAGAENSVDPEMVSFFYLDGEAHRRRRAAVSHYFTPKAIVERYNPVIYGTTEHLLAGLRREGSAVLDIMSFKLAVAVAAEIVGLTEQDNDSLAKRMRATLDSTITEIPNPVKRAANAVRVAFHMWNFYRKDLAPAVRARRACDRDDVIGYLVRNNYTTKAMIIECLTYAGAGMVTTREFIVVCAWHLFDNAQLRERFLAGEERDQFAILNEILRLEPVAAMLSRKSAVRADEIYALDVRAANTDEAVTGPCPFAIDPDRAKRMKVEPSYMSFGDGHHRCPGAQVALHETRVFLDALLRVPGIRLDRPPEVLWSKAINGYELRGAMVACDKG